MKFLQKLAAKLGGKTKQPEQAEKEKLLQLDIFSTSFQQFIQIVGTSGERYKLSDPFCARLGFNPNHLKDYIKMVNRGYEVGEHTIFYRLAEYFCLADNIDFEDLNRLKRAVFNIDGKNGHSIGSIYQYINQFAHDLAFSFDHKDIQAATWQSQYSEDEIRSSFWSRTLVSWENVGEYLQSNRHGFNN
ncbi:hypothetical protein [Photobacterium leiognathi]|uniref:hypothetical protein n=1 Tax=Photobacterium leiognathi TaxID=553611 RepID=UPI0029828992|nr:hypothetical protein [Photobacterium leiognathi]